MSRISTKLSDSIAAFNSSTATSKAFDITSYDHVCFTVGVTGAGGAGTMKLQGSINPSDANGWVDIPSTTQYPTTQTITVGTTQHYLATGLIAYPAIRVSVTSSNANNITVAISGNAKG